MNPVQSATDAITFVSLATMDAALPKIKPLSPAVFPLGISVARRSKQSPSPKRTLNTIPIAASSLSLVVLLIPMISKTPMQPKTNAPVISPSIDLPCMPKATITIKATVIPGNVA